VVVNNTPLIYNIPNNTWVQNFVVSNTPPPTKTTSTSTLAGPTPSPSNTVAPSPPQKQSSSLGTAVGGAAGGIAAIAAIGFFFYRRRKRAGNGGRRSSPLKRSGYDNTAGFRKKGEFLGRNNRDDAEDDMDPYGNYPGVHAVQLQDTSTQHGRGDSDIPSSSQSIQQYQSSSPPLPPLLQYLPPRPETQNRNTILSYRGSPRDLKSEIDLIDQNRVSSGEQESLRFSGISSSPPPLLPFQPRQSIMSSTPTGIPQREEGYPGFSSVDPYGQSMYHDAGKNVLSDINPQGPLGSFPVGLQNRSTYYNGSSSILSGPYKSPDSHLISTPYGTSPQYNPIGPDGQGARIDSRSSQQIGPGYDTNPAAWTAAMNARSSFASPQAIITQGSDNSGEIGNRGSYYPPPPGQQQPPQSESELMQKKLRLLKAQHELDVEKMRLEQESQRQLIERQLVHGSG